jgi:hypothetical protein
VQVLTNRDSTPQTWQIYALGGGWGHLNRALCLARIAAHQRFVRIITNSPYASYITSLITQETSQILIETISPEANFQQTCTQVQNTLLKQDYDCLIVDTFPRGLGGELVKVFSQLKRIPKVLIHRDLNPDYIAAKDLTNFVNQNYNLVIIPGDSDDSPFADLPNVTQTLPWLIRSFSELEIDKAYNCLKLSYPQEKPVILVSSSGQPSELELFGLLTQELSDTFPEVIVRCLAPICPANCPKKLWVSQYPGIECLPATDLVVGSGGYNTVNECLALQIPLVGIAYPRLYDRQTRRLQNLNIPFHPVTGNLETDVREAIALVHNFLPLNKSSTPIQYHNGAIAAVNLIEQLTST